MLTVNIQNLGLIVKKESIKTDEYVRKLKWSLFFLRRSTGIEDFDHYINKWKEDLSHSRVGASYSNPGKWERVIK